MGSDEGDTILADVAELKGGYAFKSSQYVESGRFVLRTVNIRENGGITREGAVYISEEDAQEFARFELQEFDTLFVMVGATLGKVGFVQPYDLPSLLNQNMWVIRSRSDSRTDRRYLNYWVEWNVKKTLHWASGSARGFVRRDDYRKLPFFEIPIGKQKAIAHILGSLDDKIELNRRMNQTLEAMAQALFKSWFVDFDPVIDNALAAGKPIPDALQARAQTRQQARENATTALPASVRELFPSEFEFTDEMGWVPKGWSSRAIHSMASIIKGKSYKSSELTESKTALVTLKSFLRGGGYRHDGLKPYTGTFKPEQVVKSGDLVIAYTDVTQSADVIGKPALVMPDSRFETLVISLDVAVLRPDFDQHKYFFYGLARTDRFQQNTLAYSTGTTVLHLGKSAVPDYEFACPPDCLISAYSQIAESLFKSVHFHRENGAILAKLRNTLLPKLISGELRIPDAEKLVAEAGL